MNTTNDNTKKPQRLNHAGIHNLVEGQEIHLEHAGKSDHGNLNAKPNHTPAPELKKTIIHRDYNTLGHNPNHHHTSDHKLPSHHQYQPDSPIKVNLSPRIMPESDEFKPTAKQKRAIGRLKLIASHKYWHNASLVVGTVLVFLLVFNSQWFISQFIYIFSKPNSTPTAVIDKPQTPATSPASEPATLDPASIVGPQNEMIISKIGVTAPLVFIPTNNEREVLDSLQNGIVHYYGTAKPGENGNSVFFGHSSNDWWEVGNYKFIFILLEKLAVGDTYEMHYNSIKYIYEVTATKVVEPNDFSVLNQTKEPTSTLITCTPPGTTWKRFIVSGKQISPSIIATSSKAQTAPSAIINQPELPSAPANLWDQIVAFFNQLFGGDKNKPAQEATKPDNVNRLPEFN